MRQMRRILFLVMAILLLSGCNTYKTAGRPDSGPLCVSGWLAAYDFQRGVNSFSSHIQFFDEINPVWYNLNPGYFSGGQAPLLDYSGDKSVLLSLARGQGIKVLPTIQNFGVSNFDPLVISKIINSPALRARHIAEIVSLVVGQSYDGVDIDYENLSSGDRDAFSAFIAELGQALAEHRKLLSVTVYAKTTGSESWDGPGAQNWASLVKAADTLKVMVYDYHWVTFHAGPISPIDLLQAVLNYARRIPGIAGKLVVGLPFYGLDWPDGAAGREMMYEDAVNMVRQGITSQIGRNSVYHSDPYCSAYYNNVEPHFTYIRKDTGTNPPKDINHTVYFQDAASLRSRLNLIAQYRDIVKGITFWHLGGEDPESWDVIQSFK